MNAVSRLSYCVSALQSKLNPKQRSGEFNSICVFIFMKIVHLIHSSECILDADATRNALPRVQCTHVTCNERRMEKNESHIAPSLVKFHWTTTFRFPSDVDFVDNGDQQRDDKYAPQKMTACINSFFPFGIWLKDCVWYISVSRCWSDVWLYALKKQTSPRRTHNQAPLERLN